jgi:hypothetical protein
LNSPTSDLAKVKEALSEFAFSHEGASGTQLQADFAELLLQIFRLAERLQLDLVAATEELLQHNDLQAPLLTLVPDRRTPDGSSKPSSAPVSDQGSDGPPGE